MRDKVTPEMHEAVIRRDAGCVAPRLDTVDRCSGRLTLDHVKEQPMMGKRAPSDLEHLATLCWHHHLDGWATAHRPLLREYLAEVNHAER